MSTNAYQGRTTVTELRDMIRKLGGVPKGNTKAALQDQLEQLMTTGGVGPDEIRRIVEETVAEQLPSVLDEAIETGPLTPSQMDDIFGD